MNEKEEKEGERHETLRLVPVQGRAESARPGEKRSMSCILMSWSARATERVFAASQPRSRPKPLR